MKTKEEEKNQCPEEDSDLTVEELTNIEGGIEDNDDKKEHCGLGCFVGSGFVGGSGND